MKCIESIMGIIEVDLISANIEDSLKSINENGITITRLEQKDNLCACFYIKRTEWKTLQLICKKRDDKVKIIGKKGVYWSIRGILHRPVMLLGMILLLGMTVYLPTRILFVQVEGNTAVPDQKILCAGENSGIYFGASRRVIRSEKVKNALLSLLPELQWAGVNTKGCVAIISVKERTEPEEQKKTEYISSIVADRDGVITSCTIDEGNLLCSVGQSVRRGQLLISGYTDCGFFLRASNAAGDIFAQTDRNIDVVIPTEYFNKHDLQSNKVNISLLIGKKRINLWKDSGILDASCDRMYEEYYVALPGSYQLPIGIGIDSCAAYQLQPSDITQKNLKGNAAEYGKNYIFQHMIAGNILSNYEVFTTSDNTIYMTGEYVCTEMIGRVQREQNGEDNGENN